MNLSMIATNGLPKMSNDKLLELASVIHAERSSQPSRYRRLDAAVKLEIEKRKNEGVMS